MSTKAKKQKPIIVRADVEFAVEPDDVDYGTREIELAQGLIGELVKVKSGEYENRFYGTIITVTTLGWPRPVKGI